MTLARLKSDRRCGEDQPTARADVVDLASPKVVATLELPKEQPTVQRLTQWAPGPARAVERPG